MRTNISNLNRITRSLIGVILLVIAAVLWTKTSIPLSVIGGILIFTGLIGFCPIDYYFHMKRQP